MLLTPADYVLPLGLLGVFLVVRLGHGHGVIEGGSVRRPGEGMHVQLFAKERQSFTARNRDEPQAIRLGRFALRSAACSGCFASHGAVADEGDPLAVRAPLGVFFAARVGQRMQAGLCGPQPQVVPPGACLPVGALGGDDRRGAVGRKASVGDFSRVQELIESDGGLRGLGGRNSREEAEDSGQGDRKEWETHNRTITARVPAFRAGGGLWPARIRGRRNCLVAGGMPANDSPGR